MFVGQTVATFNLPLFYSCNQIRGHSYRAYVLSYQKNENICERPLLRHTAVSSITSSAIADEDSSLLPTCTAVVRDCVYEFCTIHTESYQNACASAVLRLRSLHMNGVVSSAIGMRCI